MISYDLFDTLITRDLYKPSDIFFFVGKKALELGIIKTNPEDFMNIRIKAEVLARKKSKYEEVTIHEIYQEMKSLLALSDTDCDKLKTVELEFERKSLYRIAKTTKQMSSDDIIISDTYLPIDFVKDILENHSIKYKDIFLSSELRATKYYGSIYTLVKNKYSIDRHIGDNPYSDFKNAMDSGIHAELFSDSKPTRYEKLLYESNLDFEIKSIIAGVMKVTRLLEHYEDEQHQNIHILASNVIAPFLYCYVNWILKEASRLGIETLFFISRDGQILYKIAQIINDHLNLGFELKYLYGSRKAWHLPAVTEVDSFVLDWIFDDTYYLTLEDIAKRSGIEPDILLQHLDIKIDPRSNLDKSFRIRLKQEFHRNKEIQKLILDASQKKRNVVIRYLKQEGFSTDKRIAIVDVGWRGRQQVSLSKILDMGGLYPKDGIVGFYVGLVNPVSPYKRDKFITFFSEEHKDILSYPAIYETFVAADHGSCIGYEYDLAGTVKPVLREQVNTRMIEWGLQIQHKAIIQFATNLTRALTKYKSVLRDEVKVSYKLLKTFLKFPSYTESELFAKVELFEDQEENNPICICEKIGIFKLIKFFFKIEKLSNHNVWVEGSITFSFKNSFRYVLLLAFHLRSKFKNYISTIFSNFQKLIASMRWNFKKEDYHENTKCSMQKHIT